MNDYFKCKHCKKDLDFMDYPVCPFCGGLNE